MPELRERSPVQLDGRLSFPLVGEIDAADRTIAEVRERIRTAIASRLVPHYTPDGRELMRSVDRSQVSAAVAEYRPVFVAGDVLSAGELVFRPGMTARQAVAAAGGRAPTLPAAVPDLVGLQRRLCRRMARAGDGRGAGLAAEKRSRLDRPARHRRLAAGARSRRDRPHRRPGERPSRGRGPRPRARARLPRRDACASSRRRRRCSSTSWRSSARPRRSTPRPWRRRTR